MSTLPLPVRVAVGLAVTAVEQARKLPEQLSDLPVTAASRAVQAAMRVQQRVTELAIKGDQVCALFQPVEDSPPWARFDEDDELDASGGAARTSTGSAPSTAPDGAPLTATATEYGEIDEADVARAMTPTHPAMTDGQSGHPGSDDPSPDRAEVDPPPVLSDYNDLSLAQLRGKLRALSLLELTKLLEYEHAHQDRAAFVTMLSNRISTVRSHSTKSQ
jgi:hypothetical protein